MKKFVIEHVGKGAAAGATGFGLERSAISHLSSETPIRTPALWIGTRAGSVPTLTPETVEMGGLRSNPEMFAGLLVPMQDLIKSVDVLAAFQKGERTKLLLSCLLRVYLVSSTLKLA